MTNDARRNVKQTRVNFHYEEIVYEAAQIKMSFGKNTATIRDVYKGIQSNPQSGPGFIPDDNTM